MLALPHLRKPPRGRPVDWGNALNRGLACFVPCWEGSTGPAYDLVSGLKLAPAATIPATTFGSGPGGLALGLSQPTGVYSAPAPASLQPAYPVTIALGFRSLGARTGAATLGGLTSSSAWSGAFGAALFYFPSASLNAMNLVFNSAGTPTFLTNLAALPAGVDVVWSASIGPASQALYDRGKAVYQGTATVSPPTYGASPLLLMGNHPGIAGGNAYVLMYWMALWTRLLSPAEHGQVAANPWQLLLPFSDNWWIEAAAAPPGYGGGPVIGSAVVRYPVVPN